MDPRDQTPSEIDVGCEQSACDPTTTSVLLAEDDALVRRVIAKLLARAGYRCTCAVDGVQAYELLQVERFDLLITDLDMPRMNGVELIRKLRADPRHDGLAIIVCSGSPNLRRLDLSQLDVAAVLVKPFASRSEFCDVVARALLN